MFALHCPFYLCVCVYIERVCVVISVFIFVEDLQKKQEKALEPIIHALYIYCIRDPIGN